jgi:hypothetical protein
MFCRHRQSAIRAAAVLAVLSAIPLPAQRDEIAYQGRIVQNGSPFNGTADLQFTLYSTPLGGAPIGDFVSVEDVIVTDGYFALGLDLIAGLKGTGDRYLQVQFRPGNSVGLYTDLEGRVPLRSVPYAVDSATVGGLAPEDLAPASHTHSSLSRPSGGTPVAQVSESGLLTISEGFRTNQTIDAREGIAFDSAVSIVGSSYRRIEFVSGGGVIAVAKGEGDGVGKGVTPGAELVVDLQDDLRLVGTPAEGHDFDIAVIEPTLGGDVPSLRLNGANSQDATGGLVSVTGGNATATDATARNGGNVRLSGGAGVNGGLEGEVEVLSNLSVNRTNPTHPIHVGTAASNGNGAHLTNGGVWTNGSDVNSKTDFAAVDVSEILARVVALPVSSWRYHSEPSTTRHVGPMAQDFAAAFGLGESKKHIGTVDADGVALAAIKGLHAELENLRAENEAMRQRLAALEAQP